MAKRTLIKRVLLWTGAAVVVVVLLLAALLIRKAAHYDEWLRSQIPRYPEQEELVHTIAQELMHAVNEYYSRFGEYPPYLLGGWASGLKLEDPLIEAGVLQKYPLPPPPDPNWENGWGVTPMNNVVSSPNDPLVQFLREEFLQKALAEAKDEEKQEHPPWWRQSPTSLEVEELMNQERYLCGGGIVVKEEPRTHGTRAFATYSTNVSSGLKLWGEDPHTVRYLLQSDYVDSQFGYQRGEHIGGNEKQCWLWFYAYETVVPDYFAEAGEPPARVVGMDLVDNDDGLIRPDGIPDGIVLLYKLKEGKVVEVVKDYD